MTNVEQRRVAVRMEERKLARQTYGIVAQMIGLVVAAFAAGAAWVHYFHP